MFCILESKLYDVRFTPPPPNPHTQGLAIDFLVEKRGGASVKAVVIFTARFSLYYPYPPLTTERGKKNFPCCIAE